MIAVRLHAFSLVGAISLSLACGSLAKPARAKATTAKPAASQPAVAKPDGPKPNADWQVIKVGPRDYLSAENIAKFYGLLGNVDSTGKVVVLNNGRNQLQLTLNSREALVNGLRNWLSFPVIAQDGK